MVNSLISVPAAGGVSMGTHYQNDSSYVVGGQPGTLPCAASVQRYGHHICSGTLVDKQHVYVPAQCVE